MKLTYPACFYPDEEVGGYWVSVPDLPGCLTQGDSLEDAIWMAQDAASLWLLDSVEHGEKLPAASAIGAVELEQDNGIVSMILVDLEEYAKHYSSKKVKKTLTLPVWANTAAKKMNINFSALLEEAILERLQV